MTDYIICAKCKEKEYRSSSHTVSITDHEILGYDELKFSLCHDCYSKLEPILKKFIGWKEEEC